MDITLLKIRQVLSPTFGIDSFAVNMIKGAHANENLPYPTMGMNANGYLEYSPTFVQEHIKTDVDLFSVLSHEFLHLALSHFIHDAKPDSVEHIAIDAVCNSMITRIWPEESKKGAFFRKFYADDLIPNMILRPGSKHAASILSKLYPQIWTSRTRPSTIEIINVMKTLITPASVLNVDLLGNHGSGAINKEMAEKFLSELKRAIKSGKFGSEGSGLQEELLKLIDTNLSIRVKLLSRYACSMILGYYLAPSGELERTEHPVMINPSQRDLINLVNLGNVYTYHNLDEELINEESRGVVVYCDSSGSVTAHLPKIISILQRSKSQLSKLYWFSTRVSKADLGNMSRVKTTYGTDFTCIAESMLQHNYKKAVIFTDGHANMDEDVEEFMDELKPEILTILFSQKPNKDHILTKWGQSMLLEEAIDTYEYA